MLRLIEITGGIKVCGSVNLTGNIKYQPVISVTGNIIVGSSRDYEKYEGEYIVIPKVYDQILETDGLAMNDDVTVKEITYNSTENIKGGLTVQIGEI